MRNIEIFFKNKAIEYSKLKKYGFEQIGEKYIFRSYICNQQFELIVEISEESKTSKLIDLASDEEYVLADIAGATGEFIGRVKEEYENKLQEIADKCTTPNIFKSSQSKEVIEYIRAKYKGDLEFLWEKFDNNAIWRNKDNGKWYGLILTVPKSKLGIASEEIVEIIDLRYQKDKTEEIVDNKYIFYGYHMNKKSWITIKLDNSVKTDKIFELIDNSYSIVAGNK